MRFGIWRHRNRYSGTHYDRNGRASGDALRDFGRNEQAVLFIGSKRLVRCNRKDFSKTLCHFFDTAVSGCLLPPNKRV